ncbi:YggS family pyridoxal phosphate-dependent enzyme [Sphingobacterium sp. IITKGP-BTPF85]|uniref:YggS family pyridoxal phosphate-dependent enzyme n=1 Tax=Sphingobacterium sp. IITKGP-BTPF85 TaxID=1338009 RepID=UPI000389DDB8|nr:YggS family pyridoxal phosphate-dependent enzyme [Sphingobacterium sp. IITKGP-BTPF85]KKX49419.1 YggS family pyridoxal phosphate enzyme [Sphingobacterium sp. IITKGP-BTPF85]
MTNTTLENLKVIEDKIKACCLLNNRDPKEVKLLLATKTVPANRIKTALLAGYTLIAENKVQELRDKYDYLKNIPHTNHFIGHLQTNKIKYILQHDVTCVQSIDRFDLAQKINQRVQLENRTIDILIQVNTSMEESKFGISPDKTIDLIRQLAILENVKIKGLMTIGLFSAEEDKIRTCFRLLKNLQQDIIKAEIPGVEMTELSMGMSGDYEIAIAEGATILRIGTAVFGKRIYPDSHYWDESKN